MKEGVEMVRTEPRIKPVKEVTLDDIRSENLTLASP